MTSPTKPDDPGLGEARLAVLAAVSQGDAGLAFDVVGELMGEGHDFESILFDVIAPLQSEIGKRWQQGDFAIAEEHAATGAIETLVALLSGTLLTPDEGPRVVVVTAEGDAHSLPARMLAAYLLYLGWRVTYLGASVPAADLTPYLQSIAPAAVVLSCALASRLPGARASVKAVHDAGVPVLVGGRGFGPDDSRARAIGADAFAATHREVDATLRTWRPDPVASEATVAERELLDQLEEMALHVLAAATDATVTSAAAEADGRARRSVRSDLRLFYDALQAAVLVDEPELLAELASWHARLERRPAGGATTSSLLTGLRTAVATHAEGAVPYLDAALAASGEV